MTRERKNTERPHNIDSNRDKDEVIRQLRSVKAENMEAWRSRVSQEGHLNHIYTTHKIMTNEKRYKYSSIDSKLGREKLEREKNKLERLQKEERETMTRFEKVYATAKERHYLES